MKQIAKQQANQDAQSSSEEPLINYAMELSEILKLTHECSCDACSIGCQYGSGAMTDEDIKNLAIFLDIDEATLKEKYLEEVEKFNTKRFRPKILRKNNKPYGKCIFYNKKQGCMIHPAKPLECKISMGCKSYGPELSIWFTLHYFVNPDDPESLRQWAIYQKTHPTIPGGSFEELIPNEEERKKIFTFQKLK